MTESATIEPDAPGKEEEDPVRADKRKVDKPSDSRSSIMKEIERDGEVGLRDWLNSLGSTNSIKILVTRTKPETVVHPVSGASLQCAGHLATYEELFDEEFLKEEWGGGTYHIKPMLPNKKGSFVYVTGAHRTIRIAGLPRWDRISGVAPIQSPIAAAPQAESPGAVKVAMETMERMIDRTEQRGKSSDEISPAMQLVLDGMQRTSEARDRELAELRRELASSKNQKPAENPLMDKILANAIDGQSGHVEALRLRYEAELRQVKESGLQDLRRVEDRHDRQMSEVRQSHELALSSLKSSYEREITALRSSHEVTVAASRASHDVQMHTLKGDVTRLERDNAELRSDLAALRATKDKSIIEQIKDIKVLKETFLEDDGEETSAIGKLAAAVTPENIAAVGAMIRPPTAPGGTQPVQAQQPPRPPPRRVVRAVDPKDGQTKTFVQEGNQLHPATRKPKMVEGADGKPIEVPVIDPGQMTQMISYLENAFGNSVDPDIIAQSARSFMPPDIMTWLRANDTEQVSGIDLFMARVARLPGSSPLATQKGKNWLRQVGKALVS